MKDLVEISSEVESKDIFLGDAEIEGNFQDSEDFEIWHLTKYCRIITRRHNYEGNHNYWTVVYDECKAALDDRENPLEIPGYIPYCRRSEKFEDALKNHFNALKNLN